MAIVATQEEQYQDVEFTPQMLEQLGSLVTTALKKVSGDDIHCPPIIYIPLNMSTEDLLHKVRTTGPEVRKNEVLQSAPIFTGKSTYEEFVRHVDHSKQLRAMRSVCDDEEEKLAISRFDARQRKPNEEWGDLSNALTGLAKKAYPRKSDMEIKGLVKSRVLSQVQNHPMFSNDISLHDLVITLMAEDVIPVPYSGEGDEAAWENWITKFEQEISRRNLDENDRIKWLKARLNDHALNILTALERDAIAAQGQLSYTAVKEAVQTNVYSRCLETRQKKTNEELEIYAKVLSGLAEKAYPYQPQVEKSRLVLCHLKPYLHLSIQTKEWNSVDEALAVNFAVNVINQPFAANGSNGLDEWLETFEYKADDYSLDSSTRLLWLESRLTGSALECFRSLPEESRKDYHSAKNAFRTQLYKNSFDSKNNLMEGNLIDLGKELSLLSAGAYPEMLESERQSWTLNCFLAIVSTRHIHFNLTPRTIDEAISFLAAQGYIPEVFHGVDGCWEKWTKNVERFICSTTDLKYDEMIRCIQTRLGGEALQIFVSVLEDRNINLEVLIENYLKKLFDHWLHHRQKRKSETWNSYVQDFISLGKRIQLEQIENVVLEHVLTQVNEFLKSIHWSSLDEAIDVISAAEEMLPFSNESNESWAEWREKFEHVAQNHKLDDNNMTICIGSLLSGNAQKAFHNLQSNIHQYEQMIDSLTNAIYIDQFKSSKRNMTHTWGKYATELYSLAQKAFPDRDDKEKIVLEHILSQVSEENRSKPWTSLNEAITVMSEEEIPAYANEEGEWWEEWIQTFQQFVDKHSLDNTRKLEWLTCKLIRSAKKIFDEMLPEDKTNFDRAIKCIGEKVYNERFVSARRVPQRGLHEYAKYLSSLVERIHPEMSAKDKEQVVLARIVSEVGAPDLKQWTCLNEAVDVILANEEVPVYCDQDDWIQWKFKFQNAAKKHSLSIKRKILWLSCLLSGEAKRLFDALPEEYKLDYDLTIHNLQKNLYISRFMGRKKKDYETWETLQIELCSLAKDCYPGKSNSDLDKIVLKQLCSIIKDQNIILHEEPTSLDDAILTVSAYEAVPTPYTEDGNWEKWIHTFEKSLHTKKITDNDIKLRYLQLRLTGKASTLFSGIVKIQSDFDKVKKLLGVEIYRNKFEKQQKQFGQTWRQYADELRNLGEKIYPPDQLGKCVLDKILSDPRAAEMKYSGDVREWDAWIENFDQIVHSCSLDDVARLKWFDTSLIGHARTICNCEIPKKCVTSYIEAKGAMEKRMNTNLFYAGVRADNESVQSFILRLRKYAGKAFPGDGAEKMTLQKIKELMIPDGINDISFSTVNEAILTITALEEMKYCQYHDGDDWEWWLSQFEKVASRNRLKEAEKLQWLKAGLTGNALEAFNSYFSPSQSTYESTKNGIGIALKAHKKLSLKKCTKCSCKPNEPMCHTVMVPLSIATSGFMSMVHKVEESLFYSDKVCKNCSGAIGTKGCTPIGNGVQHNC
eukprot:Em0006g689a